MSEPIDYTPRERAALGGDPGICRALDLGRTFMCDLDAGHDGPHAGFELPTVTLDEGDPTGTFCRHGWHFQNPEPCPGCWPTDRTTTPTTDPNGERHG